MGPERENFDMLYAFYIDARDDERSSPAGKMHLYAKQTVLTNFKMILSVHY